MLSIVDFHHQEEFANSHDLRLAWRIIWPQTNEWQCPPKPAVESVLRMALFNGFGSRQMRSFLLLGFSTTTREFTQSGHLPFLDDS